MSLRVPDSDGQKKQVVRHGRTCSGHPRPVSARFLDVDARDKRGHDDFIKNSAVYCFVRIAADATERAAASPIAVANNFATQA